MKKSTSMCSMVWSKLKKQNTKITISVSRSVMIWIEDEWRNQKLNRKNFLLFFFCFFFISNFKFSDRCYYGLELTASEILTCEIKLKWHNGISCCYYLSVFHRLFIHICNKRRQNVHEQNIFRSRAMTDEI